jgi:hypothetical protein
MNYIYKTSLIISTFVLSVLLSSDIFPQSKNISEYQYISPLPGSKMVSKDNNIVIRKGDIIDKKTINNYSIQVTGSVKDNYLGSIKLLDDLKTIIFNSDYPFYPGEIISVKLNNEIKDKYGRTLPELVFQFTVSSYVSKPDNEKSFFNFDFIDEIISANSRIPEKNNKTDKFKSVKEKYDLPDDFPEYEIVESNNPAPGYYFLASTGQAGGTSIYLIIMDNIGIPIYYTKLQGRPQDFKLQDNGYLSYYYNIDHKYLSMDSSYNVIDDYSCGNGYSTDGHELRVLENGHAFLLSYDPQIVDMSQIVLGGNTEAVVIGLIVQELDTAKNVIFQWRSWDHFDILDCDTNQVDLRADEIDYVHGNAIGIDNDGNILISCRHFNEITKINRQTGYIIWRLGGKNNQFVFVNDPIGFTDQHSIRQLDNGNITLFDDGNYHNPPFSRGIEYEIDEESHMVTLLNNYRHNPDISTKFMGHMQKLNNGHALVSWSFTFSDYLLTEFDNNLNTALEITTPANNLVTYRAFKFQWETNLFVTETDTVFFDITPIGDSAFVTISILNNSSQQLAITNCYNHENAFSLINSLPIIIQANSSADITFKFIPTLSQVYTDIFTLCSDKVTSRVARQLYLFGLSNLMGYDSRKSFSENCKIYPNPFSDKTLITLSNKSEINKIEIFDMTGKFVNIFENIDSHEFIITKSNLNRGVYLINIFTDKKVFNKKLIVN